MRGSETNETHESTRVVLLVSLVSDGLWSQARRIEAEYGRFGSLPKTNETDETDKTNHPKSGPTPAPGSRAI